MSVVYLKQRTVLKKYSAIVRNSSEFVEISSEFVEISSDLVRISSDLVSRISELLIIRAFKIFRKSVSRTLISTRNEGKGDCAIFTLVKLFVKTIMSETSGKIFFSSMCFAVMLRRYGRSVS